MKRRKVARLAREESWSGWLRGYVHADAWVQAQYAVTAEGVACMTGYTESSSFPTTGGAFQTTCGGSGDAFLAKLNATGTALVYSNDLGGSSADEGTDGVLKWTPLSRPIKR